ncbi:MAG: Ldh family oxidoreductase [Proteobacteria bacterium]|nr:Ldh family oxidoreductase [Pseudomonadota bacterium]
MTESRTDRTSFAMSLDDIATLVSAALMRHGCDQPNLEALVRTVVAAERDGSRSHGLFRVPGYVAALRSGRVNGRAIPRVTQKTPVVIQVDGECGFAPLALERGIPMLTDAAKRFGVAVMTITRSFHFAALWPETEAIAAEGLVAIACVSYVSCVAPFGGTKPLFGTNPISFAWPRPGRPPVVADMATAAMAQGEVQIAARDCRPVPLGTGLDSAGQETTDAAEILKGALLPFGGYKGSALALLVELLAAGAVGERFSFEAGAEDVSDGGPPRGGEFLVAISPDLLAGPGWASHCEEFFKRFDSIKGARLPGVRRLENRLSSAPRIVNAQLVADIRALCG